MRSGACALLVVSALAGAGARTAPDETARIRSHDKRVVAAMDEARRRSSTFRGLYDRVGRSDLIIYVEPGRCPSIYVLSCLSVSAAAPDVRYLRITIDTQHSQGVIIQQIAHELQHAVEIAGAPTVADAAGLRALYRRIGRPGLNPDIFETTAALAMTAAVSSEVK